MVETTSDDFTYCVITPERIDENGHAGSSAFGVGPKNDPTGVYDKIFGISTDSYKILAMCIYEVIISLNRFN
jgi:hypothetical protein